MKVAKLIGVRPLKYYGQLVTTLAAEYDVEGSTVRVILSWRHWKVSVKGIEYSEKSQMLSRSTELEAQFFITEVCSFSEEELELYNANWNYNTVERFYGNGYLR